MALLVVRPIKLLWEEAFVRGEGEDVYFGWLLRGPPQKHGGQFSFKEESVSQGLSTRALGHVAGI